MAFENCFVVKTILELPKSTLISLLKVNKEEELVIGPEKVLQDILFQTVLIFEIVQIL